MVGEAGLETATLAMQSYIMPFYSIKQAIQSYEEKVRLCKVMQGWQLRW